MAKPGSQIHLQKQIESVSPHGIRTREDSAPKTIKRALLELGRTSNMHHSVDMLLYYPKDNLLKKKKKKP